MINIYTGFAFPDLSGRGRSSANVDETVAAIIADVRENGDAALRRYAEKFDGAAPKVLEVAPEELDAACEAVGEEYLTILREARENIAAFHRKQVRQGYNMAEKPGIVLGQKVTPVDRVGVYVPGGTAAYPSTVLMDVLPAKIAGVGEVVMVTPCKQEGIPAPILAAAKVAGVDRVFRVGGAQAVAALSYGTETIPRVDKIVGPGNIFVATAKRMVYGQVDIDMIAGPSEIMIIADKTANPRHLAADLLSQAEHDMLASAVLVTPSRELAQQVQAEVERQLTLLPRESIARRSIDDYGMIIVSADMEQAVEIANTIAPEHLEVCVDEPFALLPMIRHAGSIFLGKYAPEALGDYFAGPNHTLPTNGTARFSSPLSVDDFVKRSSYIYYNAKALEKSAKKIAAFARSEGLEAHARSVEVRFEEDKV